MVYQNSRINRRKENDYRQKKVYVELRTDFDRFANKVQKMIQEMDLIRLKKENATAPPCVYPHIGQGRSTGKTNISPI